MSHATCRIKTSVEKYVRYRMHQVNAQQWYLGKKQEFLEEKKQSKRVLGRTLNGSTPLYGMDCPPFF